MKAAGFFLLRGAAITLAVVAVVALWFGLQGQFSPRSLSDGLVYASFLVLAVGTLFGLFNVGYKRRPPLPGEPPEGSFEHVLKDFFHPGIFAWSIVLAGVLCFMAAVLVDLLS